MNDGPVVGVVGAETEAAVAAVEAAGGRPATGGATALVGEVDFLVAVGESALFAVARASPTVPVLPVAAGRGVRSVPHEDIAAALDALVAGDFERQSHTVASVTVADSTRARVLYDCMLTSAVPAEISEFSVHAGDERVARFRADGVVVATPAGSSGYARAAGGPVVAAGTDAAVVVPVAPFATDPDHWVVPATGVRLTVERDETAVNLVADDRLVGRVTPQEPVRVRPSGAIDVAVVGASRSSVPPA